MRPENYGAPNLLHAVSCDIACSCRRAGATTIAARAVRRHRDLAGDCPRPDRSALPCPIRAGGSPRRAAYVAAAQKLRASDVSFAAPTCAGHQCLNNARDGVTQSLPNPCGRLSPPFPVSRYVNARRPGVCGPAPIPPLRMLTIISGDASPRGRALTRNSDGSMSFGWGRHLRLGYQAEGTPCQTKPSVTPAVTPTDGG